MAIPPTSDRTRLEAQERLDLPDFNSLQDLPDIAWQRTIGALIGPGGGLPKGRFGGF